MFVLQVREYGAPIGYLASDKFRPIDRAELAGRFESKDEARLFVNVVRSLVNPPVYRTYVPVPAPRLSRNRYYIG